MEKHYKGVMLLRTGRERTEQENGVEEREEREGEEHEEREGERG